MERGRPFLQGGVKELLAEGAQELFENHKKDQSASRVPISGNIEAKADTNVWESIVSAFINAYIEAFQFKLDDTIDFGNAFKASIEPDKKEEG